MKRFMAQTIEKGQLAGFTERQSRHLATLYGTNVDQVFAIPFEAHTAITTYSYVQITYAIDS